jgi:hypothetical protein
MTPDPRRDVMVYQVAMIDALSGVSIGDRWTVWAGPESEGSFESEGDALIAAAQLAAERGLPAWLVTDTGETVAL